MNHIFVNGPINVVRLEGTFTGINKKKTLYVFMDYHESVDKQTECEEFDSIDFKDYLLNIFKNISNDNIRYDFFVELGPITMSESTDKMKKRYTDNVDKMLKKTFTMHDKKGDFTFLSKEFHNIYLHLIDVRELIEGELVDSIFLLSNLTNTLWKNIELSSDVIFPIVALLSTIKTIMLRFYSIFIKNQTNIKPNNALEKKDKLNILMIELITKKIRNSYKNVTTKKLINKFIETEIKQEFTSCINLITSLEAYLSKVVYFLQKYEKNKGMFVEYEKNDLTHNIPIQIQKNIINNI